jgi:hypothetical protein
MLRRRAHGPMRTTPAFLGLKMIARLSYQEATALRDFDPPYDGMGSKASAAVRQLSGVAGRHDRCRLDHEDDSLLWRARSMDDTLRDHEALLW